MIDRVQKKKMWHGREMFEYVWWLKFYIKWLLEDSQRIWHLKEI